MTLFNRDTRHCRSSTGILSLLYLCSQSSCATSQSGLYGGERDATGHEMGGCDDGEQLNDDDHLRLNMGGQQTWFPDCHLGGGGGGGVKALVGRLGKSAG